MYSTLSPVKTGHVTRQIKSVHLERTVELEIFYPDHLSGNEILNLLLINDGQDARELQLEETLNRLFTENSIGPLVIVAVKSCEERLEEYGVASLPDFKGRGARAADYTLFITQELLPYLQDEAGITIRGKRAFAGCSLGGLTAFDIAWHNPDLFDITGVFSGSFWWRKKDLTDGYTDADRIMHQVIRDTAYKPDLKFWLMTGTEDETADRNQNFIIDSIDDTIDIIKELTAKGYKRPDDIFYYEMVGGQHNTKTWAKAMPAFLIWAFGKNYTPRA